MHTPEWHEKQEVKRFLDEIGAWHFSPLMSGYGKAGIPDIVALHKGRFYGLEVKREGKGPTTLQMRRINEITRAGGYAWAGTAEVLIRKIRETL